MNELTQAKVKYIFDYKDGVLYWKQPAQGRQLGHAAGYEKKNGYRTIGLNNEYYFAHRIIYLYHHGVLPEFLDHIDRNPKNNKIENLRAATKTQNKMNTVKRRGNNGKLNTSNFKGVSWDKENTKWIILNTKTAI